MAGKKGYCWPRIDYICVGLDLDPKKNHRNVVRRLSKLESLGYIKRYSRYDNRTTGRQMSNKIIINYVSSISTKDQEIDREFTTPINININNLTLKEKINKKEKSLNDVWTYPQVRLVYGWHKGGLARGSGFQVMRSKSLLGGLARDIQEKSVGKWAFLLAGKGDMKQCKPKKAVTERKVVAVNDDFDDLLFKPAESKPLEQELPRPAIQDVPPPEQVNEPLSVGSISWPDICVQMNRINDQFIHWNMRIYMNGMRGSTLELFAETPFFRDACQQRFGEDLLTACKRLNYPVKFVNIKLRDK